MVSIPNTVNYWTGTSWIRNFLVHGKRTFRLNSFLTDLTKPGRDTKAKKAVMRNKVMWRWECGWHLLRSWKASSSSAAAGCLCMTVGFLEDLPVLERGKKGPHRCGVMEWCRRDEREERSPSCRPQKNPDTVLHIKERASDTIICLGCESST